MHSLIHIGFENFKLFRERTGFDLEMVNIFTGPNNSGKSSVLEGLNLLFRASSGYNKNGLRVVRNVGPDIRSRGSKKKTIAFITGIQSETPMKPLDDVSVGEEFVVRVCRYYVERVYKVNKKSLSLETLNFYLDSDLNNRFLQIHFLSGYKAKISFDLLSYMKLNFLDLEDFLNKTSFDRLQEHFGRSPVLNDLPLAEAIKATYFESVKIEYDNSEQSPTDWKFLIEHPLHASKPLKIEMDFTLTNGITDSPLKKPDGMIQAGYFLKAYIRYLERYVFDDLSFPYSFNNPRGEELKLHLMEIINEQCVQGFIDAVPVFNTICTLENEPYQYLWGGPNIQVNRAVSYRADIRDKAYQDVLKSCSEWINSPDNKKYSLLKSILEYLQIGTAIEIQKNEKGAYRLLITDFDENKLNIQEYGFGTNQIIPIILQILNYQDWMKWRVNFILAEPEANLHPDLQSKFMEVLSILFKVVPFNFLIETHSEYMIRKIRLLVSKKELDMKYVRIYYLRLDENRKLIKSEIEIREDGSLSQEFGPGFTDEADNLAIDLFNLNKLSKN